MNFDRILKGKITSLIGLGLMIGSSITMTTGIILAMWEGAIVFGLGFLMLFMKDSIPGIILRIVDKLTNNPPSEK